MLLQLHVLQSKEARGSHTDTHTRGRDLESKTQYQVFHYSDYLNVGWQTITEKYVKVRNRVLFIYFLFFMFHKDVFFERCHLSKTCSVRVKKLKN